MTWLKGVRVKISASSPQAINTWLYLLIPLLCFIRNYVSFIVVVVDVETEKKVY